MALNGVLKNSVKIIIFGIFILPSFLFAASYNTVSVTTSATKIISKNSGRAGWAINNTAAGTLYLGFDSNVTTSNGIPLAQNQTLLDDGNYRWNGDIYGIVSSGSSDVRFIEWGLAEVSQ